MNNKRKYFTASFPSGLDALIQKELEKINDLIIEEIFDGLVYFSINNNLERIIGLPILNNIFEVLANFKNQSFDPNSTLKQIHKDPKIIQDIADSIVKFGFKSFRLILSAENQMVKVNPLFGNKFISAIIQNKKISYDPSKPETEVWINKRSEGITFINVRITTHQAYNKLLEKGELRPELAAAMCLISEPKDQDSFIDPFCGSGAIPISRIKWPIKNQIIAGDISSEKISKLTKKIHQLGLQSRINPLTLNALNMSFIDNQSIDKIVTDPPWGHFDQITDLPVFYKNTFTEFARILKKNGLLILLTAQKDLINELISTINNFKIIETYHILLSGKKAAIYKFIKQ